MPNKDPEKARENNRRWYAANAEKASERKRRAYLKKAYGFTLADYDALLTAQGGGCAICGCKEPGGHGTWHVDADHSTKPAKVRGLLCSEHNLGLGKFNHDPALLLKAVDYLAAPPAQFAR